eukprot:CRZ01715.1 hypothetical protein [Spongospora subterranea]
MSDPRVDFILATKTAKTGMPQSYRIEPSFWTSIRSEPNDPEATAERIIASFGLNIYDGACFQIAAVLGGHADVARRHTLRMLSGRSGDIDLLAGPPAFSYGTMAAKVTPPDLPYFMRTITDQYVHSDPLTGKAVDWMDWKPITGENAWANLIGPLQSLYLARGQEMVYGDPEIQLAVSRLQVFKAMQSPIGGIFYAANGTPDVGDYTEVSVENNASTLAGLRLLREILEMVHGPPDKIALIDEICHGIVSFLREVAYDKKTGVFIQGGVLEGDKLMPSNDFAVDCQSWGLTILGQADVDSWFGTGTAYKIWETTKSRAGVFDRHGRLLGVGYTDGHKIMSSEWTFGAINMCRVLASQYANIDARISASFAADAKSMFDGVQSLKVQLPDKTVSYKYASERYWIPFGWWANPVPSMTSTSWSIMLDYGVNPFVLGNVIIREPSPGDIE